MGHFRRLGRSWRGALPGAWRIGASDTPGAFGTPGAWGSDIAISSVTVLRTSVESTPGVA